MGEYLNFLNNFRWPSS